MTTVEFVNFPAHEICQDCVTRHNIFPGKWKYASFPSDAWCNCNICFICSAFLFWFQHCKAPTPGCGVTGQLPWSAPSSTSPVPLLWGSSRDPAPPRSPWAWLLLQDPFSETPASSHVCCRALSKCKDCLGHVSSFQQALFFLDQCTFWIWNMVFYLSLQVAPHQCLFQEHPSSLLLTPTSPREDRTFLSPSHSHPVPHKHTQLFHLLAAPKASHAGQEFSCTPQSPAFHLINVIPAVLLPRQLTPPTQFSHSPPCCWFQLQHQQTSLLCSHLGFTPLQKGLLWSQAL